MKNKLECIISEKCFEKKWINDKKKELSGDPILLEKTIHAFALLGFLTQIEENFLFKGGTSLLLHIPEIKRLSIDIDIIFNGNIDDFIEKISKIAEEKPFIKFEEAERGFRGLPNRRHFKFFYISQISNKENYILLDVVLDDPDYLPFIEFKPIANPLFEAGSDLYVKVPSIENLLADKLTAFAPNTIGVPFETAKGKSMDMQVVKQLYDIGELFDVSSDFENIRIAFEKAFMKENSYRDNKYTKEDVLKDTIATSLEILRINLKGAKSGDNTGRLIEGIKKLESHLLNDKFRIDKKAKITAAKVFCIANSLLHQKSPNLSDKFESTKIKELSDITLPTSYTEFNRLKPILPEAFYYIWKGIAQ